MADSMGQPEEMKEILVYSNCPQVELIVNGVPQGIKKRNSQDYPAAGLHWNCKLQAGENTVIALSKGKAVVADTLRFVYETAHGVSLRNCKRKSLIAAEKVQAIYQWWKSS